MGPSKEVLKLTKEETELLEKIEELVQENKKYKELLDKLLPAKVENTVYCIRNDKVYKSVCADEEEANGVLFNILMFG